MSRRTHVQAQNGYTLMELVVTLAVLAVLTAMALPQFDARRLQIGTAQRLILANLRVARTNAISQSVHYQVSFPSATELQVARMHETPAGSGTWQVDTTRVQTIALPRVTHLQATEVGITIEFNSRGMAVRLAAPQQLDAQDTFGVTKSLQVWPSGQVNAL